MTFGEEIDLDAIGAPTKAQVQIIQAPVIDGEMIVNPACIAAVDV